MQVGTSNGGEASTGRDIGALGGITCDEQQPNHVTQHNPHQQHLMANFHVSRPTHPVSSLVLPTQPPHHHTSVMLDDQDSFHVSRIMDNFQVILYRSCYTHVTDSLISDRF
ncbi:putative NAC domain-containing protein SOG1 [Helianthus annuus]|nr:putative NAC domain-containing protein SOG1 [Helianthus annuus]